MSQELDALQHVVDTLLGPAGCPWDKEQTPQTLCDYVLEEAYELVEAIRAGRPQEARDELGDLLFLILFVARLYQDQGQFQAGDAMLSIRDKMVRRHPHVFAETRYENQEELMRNWERIKREEKSAVADTAETADCATPPAKPKGVFDSLPKGLPPMLKAYRLNAKAARTGFTWKSDDDVARKLEEEWAEWREAVEREDKEASEAEFGDYLFALIEYGRRHGLKANAALDKANITFQSRFERMEALAHERGLDFPALSLDQMNELWDEVKLQQRDNADTPRD